MADGNFGVMFALLQVFLQDVVSRGRTVETVLDRARSLQQTCNTSDADLSVNTAKSRYACVLDVTKVRCSSDVCVMY